MHEQTRYRTERIIAAAIKVHSTIGAGCLESTYHACLQYQLRVDGLRFGHQVRLPITYQEVTLDAGYRIDFLIENCVIVELKAVEKLLINFNVPHLRHGIRRVVNNYQENT